MILRVRNNFYFKRIYHSTLAEHIIRLQNFSSIKKQNNNKHPVNNAYSFFHTLDFFRIKSQIILFVKRKEEYNNGNRERWVWDKK